MEFIHLEVKGNSIMEDTYMGMIMMFAGNFNPRNWMYCDGRSLAISQYTALFSIIGTTYGGDGHTYFNLPDLRGRVAVGVGRGPGLADYPAGSIGGSERVTLTTNELPAHTHGVQASAEVQVKIPVNTQESATTSPKGAYLAKAEHSIYMDEASGNDFLADPQVTSTISVQAQSTGVGVPHVNMQPYLGCNYIICVNGLYPPRD
jgi:microcystin-dependent protein